jgi:hypothetical protein
VNVLGAKQATRHETTEYATRADLCRIFDADMNGLYLLSFLLTGDDVTAEQCFVAGLEDSTKGTAVFREWARSWARRMIIQNAILIVQPHPTGGNSSGTALRNGAACALTQQPEVGAVIALPAFERFVFVISVLEGYSAKNCSLLLGCTRADVIAARTRALRRKFDISAELQHRSLQTQQLEVDHEIRGISSQLPEEFISTRLQL